METNNHSTVTEFLLMGFSGDARLKIPVFIIVMLVYIVALLGNSLMIIIICRDTRLHSPMYFFIVNLSLMETSNITNIVPLSLVQILYGKILVAKTHCFTQCFFFFLLVCTGYLLLPIMCYDRYVAICNPLRYTTIMNNRVCIRLVIIPWLGGLLLLLCPTFLIFRLQFCGPNIIHHFYCDSEAFIALACSDSSLAQFISVGTGLIMLLSSLGYTLMTYIIIIHAILKIPSTNGRQKAFSTCSSHLSIVSIIYGSSIFVALTPAMHFSNEASKDLAMISTIAAPLLNPFIYTFRNKKVKEALKHHLCGRSATQMLL